MATSAQLLWIVILLAIVVGPLTLAAAGLFFGRRSVVAGVAARDASGSVPGATDAAPALPLILNSAVIYALSYNVIFFIQELFLVVPKALTPGLRPTLFHNNHIWSGDNPVAALLQGTGAVGIFLTGLATALLLRALRPRSPILRLLLIWLSYHGLLGALVQVPLGALAPGADVGMAMNYLAWSSAAKTAVALVALAGIVVAALWLARYLLELAAPREISTARARNKFILKAATAAGLLGTLLIIPFRLPRELIEVLAPPLFVAVAGLSWMQAGAWLQRHRLHTPDPIRTISWRSITALLVLFAFFHLVLAPGVPFF